MRQVVLGSKLFKADRIIKQGQQPFSQTPCASAGRTLQALPSTSAETGDRWSPHWLQMNLAPPGSWGPRVTDTGPPTALECFGLEHIWVHSPVLTKGHDWDGQVARVRAGGMGPGILSVLPIQLSSAETHWVPARLPYSTQKTLCHGGLQSPSHAKHFGNMKFVSLLSSKH